MQEIKQDFSPIKRNISLYLEKNGISPYEFYKKSGISRGTPGNSTGISEDNIAKFLAYAPNVNPSWLLTGNGEMLLSDAKRQNYTSYENDMAGSKLGEASPAIYSNQTKSGLPYYDVDFLGGFNEVFNDQDTTPAYYIDFKPFNHADFWCNLSGDSMSPRLNNGDIIALKRCPLEAVQYGEIYAVVMEELRTVKILRKGKDEYNLRFIPINIENYDEQEYHISEIIGIYKVVGSIRTSL